MFEVSQHEYQETPSTASWADFRFRETEGSYDAFEKKVMSSMCHILQVTLKDAPRLSAAQIMWEFENISVPGNVLPKIFCRGDPKQLVTEAIECLEKAYAYDLDAIGFESK